MKKAYKNVRSEESGIEVLQYSLSLPAYFGILYNCLGMRISASMVHGIIFKNFQV